MSTESQIESGHGPQEKRVWYRSPIFAAVIVGICNFTAPGLWVAMNSLGGGGQASPYLVNAANALTFTLMVLTAFLGSTILNIVGVNWALFLGGLGYAPYVAGLYTNNVFGTKWLVLFGATTCGLSAGLFWAIEAAVALAYPEPERSGLFLGIWLSFRVSGQLLGGAINLGLNADRASAGAVNPKVFLVFVALQAAGPFTSFLLPKPHRIQRRDNKPVQLYNKLTIAEEIRDTARLFIKKEFLLITPLIVQGVFPEAFINTYIAHHFTVRVRALGSFTAACACVIIANIIGRFIDLHSLSLSTRARVTFVLLMTLQGGWWIWTTVLESDFPTTEAIDWTSKYFGRTFAVYVLLSANFQAIFLFLYFTIKNVATTHSDAVRIGGLLRAVESASQAVAYGTSSVESFKLLGSSSLNFALWGVAIIPAWLVIRRIGRDLSGPHDDEDEDSIDIPSGATSIVEEKEKSAGVKVNAVGRH